MSSRRIKPPSDGQSAAPNREPIAFTLRQLLYFTAAAEIMDQGR